MCVEYISIPYGAIKRCLYHLENCSYEHISIPYGAIKSQKVYKPRLKKL